MCVFTPGFIVLRFFVEVCLLELGSHQLTATFTRI